MAEITVNNLLLRTIIGIKQEEREKKQDVKISYSFRFDPKKAIETDNIEYTVDYKALNKDIIDIVEKSTYFLLEKLAAAILKRIMKDPLVNSASVTVHKPFALRFTDSVSITLEDSK